MTLALVLLAVFIGSSAQRITGMGFGLLAGPPLILAIGSFDGIVVVNVCGAVTSAAVLSRLWREVNWSRWGLLVTGAVFGVLPGAWLVSAVAAEWLDIVVGSLVVLGLVSALLVRRPWIGTSRSALAASGAVSGLMSVTAGVGGPAVSTYAVATQWPQRSFAATVQPFFLTVALLSLASKLLLEPAVSPWHMWAWVAVVLTCAGGVATGEALQSRMSQSSTKRALVALAIVGAIAAIGRGVVGIVQG